jgi:NADH-quinone oxidoreductase subunit E
MTEKLFYTIDEILEKHRFDKMHLIGILQDLQAHEKWLPREGLEYLADKLHLPINQVYHVATFFKAFYLKPRGKHTCTVCLGTACHVRGAPKLLEKLERDLNIKAGGTTSDLMFSLEVVNCVGACALGPVVICDGEYHGHMTNIKIDKLLRDMKKRDREEQKSKELVDVGSK